jgi:hypothetical protein
MVDAVPHSHDERGNSDHDHPEAYNYTRIVITATGREGAMHFFVDEGGHAVLQNIDGLFGCREGD